MDLDLTPLPTPSNTPRAAVTPRGDSPLAIEDSQPIFSLGVGKPEPPPPPPVAKEQPPKPPEEKLETLPEQPPAEVIPELPEPEPPAKEKVEEEFPARPFTADTMGSARSARSDDRVSLALSESSAGGAVKTPGATTPANKPGDTPPGFGAEETGSALRAFAKKIGTGSLTESTLRAHDQDATTPRSEGDGTPRAVRNLLGGRLGKLLGGLKGENAQDGSVPAFGADDAEKKKVEEAAAAAKAEEERVAAEKAAAEKAEAERLAVEKAAAERLAVEKAEAERFAAEKAEAGKKAAVEAAAAAAAAKAEEERLAAEKAEAERRASEQLAAAAAAKAEEERLAAEKAEAERKAAEEAEAAAAAAAAARPPPPPPPVSVPLPGGIPGSPGAGPMPPPPPPGSRDGMQGAGKKSLGGLAASLQRVVQNPPASPGPGMGGLTVETDDLEDTLQSNNSAFSQFSHTGNSVDLPPGRRPPKKSLGGLAKSTGAGLPTGLPIPQSPSKGQKRQQISTNVPGAIGSPSAFGGGAVTPPPPMPVSRPSTGMPGPPPMPPGVAGSPKAGRPGSAW